MKRPKFKIRVVRHKRKRSGRIRHSGTSFAGAVLALGSAWAIARIATAIAREIES